MYQIILLIHVFVAVFIIALVLVQQGKGATIGAAFGSGASQTVFGSRGSGSFLFRITMSLCTVFFITSLSLNYMATSAYKQVKVITLPNLPAKTQPVNNVPATPQDNTATPINTIPAPTAPNATPEPTSNAPVQNNGAQN